MMTLFKFLIAMLTSLLISGSLFAATHKAESLDRIVAVVNDAVITQSELEEAMNIVRKQLKGSNVTVPEHAALRKQVLDQMINKKLQMLLAEQNGTTISDAEVDKAISNIAKGNKISAKELYQKVSDQGLSKQEYRKEIQEELLLQHVQQQALASKINISPEEVSDFMRSKTWQAFNKKEYHLEDILITLPENPSTQDVMAAKKRAQQVLSKIHRGTSFSEVAAAESGDKNALQGGDLGWRKLPEIPSVFANELIHMKTNDLMGPVQTPNGFHIVRLVALRDVTTKMNPAAERSQVEQLIFQRKLEEALQTWITKLRSEAFINTHPENSA